MNTFPFKISLPFCIHLTALDQCFFQKFSDLCFFHFQLILIGHRLIHTSTACRKITAHRFSCLQRRFLQHFHNPSLCSSGTFLLNHKTHLLSRNAVLDQYFLIFHINITFVWKINFLYYAFVNFTFFHSLYSSSQL